MNLGSSKHESAPRDFGDAKYETEQSDGGSGRLDQSNWSIVIVALAVAGVFLGVRLCFWEVIGTQFRLD